MSTEHVDPISNSSDVARIVRQLADFLARGQALQADMTALVDELPEGNWDHPSATCRTLGHLQRSLVDCLGVLSDAVDGYLVPKSDDDDLSTRASCAVRQIGRIVAGLEVEEE